MPDIQWTTDLGGNAVNEETRDEWAKELLAQTDHTYIMSGDSLVMLMRDGDHVVVLDCVIMRRGIEKGEK